MGTGPVAYAWGVSAEELDRLRARAEAVVPTARIVALDHLEQCLSGVALVVRGHRGDNGDAVAAFIAWSEEMEEREEAPAPVLLYSTDPAADDDLWRCYDGRITTEDLHELTDYLALPERGDAGWLAEQVPVETLRAMRLPVTLAAGPDQGGLDLTHLLAESLPTASLDRLRNDTMFRIAFETAVLERLDEVYRWAHVADRLFTPRQRFAGILEHVAAWLASSAVLLHDAIAPHGIRLEPVPAMAHHNTVHESSPTFDGNQPASSAPTEVGGLRETIYHAKSEVGTGSDIAALQQHLGQRASFANVAGHGHCVLQLTDEGLFVFDVRDAADRHVIGFTVELRRGGREAAGNEGVGAPLWQGETDKGRLNVPLPDLITALIGEVGDMMILPAGAA